MSETYTVDWTETCECGTEYDTYEHAECPNCGKKSVAVILDI